MYDGLWFVFVVFFWQEKVEDNLEPEEKRFLDRLVTLGKRKGLHLSKDIQEVMQFVIILLMLF